MDSINKQQQGENKKNLQGEGKDDPRITVIKVEPTEAYYWDNKHGNAVAFVKQSIGAVFLVRP